MLLFLAPLLLSATAGNTTCSGDKAYCCTFCSAGGCNAFCSATIEAGHCAKGQKISPIPGHGEQCVPEATNNTYCCMHCSAGGCSAEYSPEDEHVPTDAGACIKGAKITPITNHGNGCGDLSKDYCCYWCSAGGCSAEYSVQDEHVPSAVGGCARWPLAERFQSHRQTDATIATPTSKSHPTPVTTTTTVSEGIKGGYIEDIPSHGQRCNSHNGSSIHPIMRLVSATASS